MSGVCVGGGSVGWGLQRAGCQRQTRLEVRVPHELELVAVALVHHAVEQRRGQWPQLRRPLASADLEAHSVGLLPHPRDLGGRLGIAGHINWSVRPGNLVA